MCLMLALHRHLERRGDLSYPRMLVFMENQMVKMFQKRVDVRCSTGTGWMPLASTFPARSSLSMVSKARDFREDACASSL